MRVQSRIEYARKDVFQIPTLTKQTACMMVFSRRSIWLLALCFFCAERQVSAGLTLDDFLPFGVENGDSQLTDGDDEAESLPFLTEFYFYGQMYTDFGVSFIPLVTAT